MDAVKEQELNLFENDKYIYRSYRGFDYGFENEECLKIFESLNFGEWPVLVDSKFITVLRKQKWRFFICDVLDNEPEASGMCYYKTKVIFVRTLSPMINSLLHELGHVFQAYAKSIDRPIVNLAIAKEASEFCDVLKDYYLLGNDDYKENDPTLSNYVLSQMTYFLDSNEYMAQSIALYLYKVEDFKKRCPLSYEVAKNIVDYLDGGREELNNMELKYGLTIQ